MSIRAIAALVIALVLAGTHWKAYRVGGASVRAECAAETAANAAAAAVQREDNRTTARAAEVKHATQGVVRERFLTRTITEVRHVPVAAACPVAPELVRLLNDAASCAGADRPAACGPDDGMPAPGPAE